jgi:NitT/TauT family transport system substrate-binding protein
MVRRSKLIALLVAGLVVSACQSTPATPTAPPQQPGAGKAAAPVQATPAQQKAAAPAQVDKVSLNVGWVLFGAQAPYFYGVDKGYFKEQGIDLEIHEGKGGAVTAQAVGANTEADMFGLIDYGTVMTSTDKGLALKGIYGNLLVSPMAVFALEETGIKSLKDLEGRTLALSPGDALTQLFPALVRVNKLDEKKIQIVNTEPAAKAGALLSKKVEAMTSFDVEQVPVIEAQGAKLTVILYADNGVNVMSNGLTTSDALLGAKKDLVRRMVAATHKSWTEATKPENRRAAAESMSKLNPQVKGKEETFYKQFLRAIDKLVTPATKGKPIGWTAKEDWESGQQLLIDAEQIKNKIDVSKYYTNEFIPQQ